MTDEAVGFNLAGYFRAESGVGEGARLLVRSLEAAGVPFTTIDYADSPSRRQHAFAIVGSGVPTYPINLVAINADVLPRFADKVGPEFFHRRYTVGIWNWETEELPEEWRGALDYVDEVWLSSNYSRDSVRRVTSKPVHTFALPILRPEVPDGLTRTTFDLPQGFMFLFTFDYFGGFRRKNPLAVVDAFTRAFGDGEGPVLVLKSVNGDREPEEAEQLRRAVGARADIRIIDGYLPAAHKNALLGLCDCYVSLHRSEGFGLTIAEAMSLGKPAIATGYSGNVDFMNEANGYLVKWTSALVGEDRFFPATAHWSEPDVDDAARIMRHVFVHPDEARERGEKAAADILEAHSPGSRTAFLRERLRDIVGKVETTSVTGSGSDLSFAMRRVTKLLAEGPAEMPTRWGGLYGRWALAFRRMLRRGLLGYEVHQRDVTVAMLDVLLEIERRQRSASEETPGPGR